MAELLTRDLINELLSEFVRRLGDTGEAYDGVIIGGAALALEAIPDRTATQDVDTFGRLSDKAVEIIGDIALEYDLPSDWLNRKAQAFMSPLASTQHLPVKFSNKDVRLRLMDDETLLALKLRAGRIAKDSDDIRALLDRLEIATLEAAAETVNRYWGGEHEMALDAVAIVEHHLSER